MHYRYKWNWTLTVTCHGGVKNSSLFATLCAAAPVSSCPRRSSVHPSQIMAYNREWGRGNESLNNSNYGNDAWNNGAGNIRSREDEYYAEGKRRKYNNGVRNHLIVCYHIT